MISFELTIQPLSESTIQPLRELLSKTNSANSRLPNIAQRNFSAIIAA